MSDTYSEKVMMRVCIWVELLSKACDYLIVSEKYYQKLMNTESALTGGTYYAGESKTTYSDYWTIEKGLSEAAVIAITSVICGSGGGNKDIAADKDEELKWIRAELKSRVSTKLKYQNYNEFEEYCNSLKKLRDKIIAHYDANAAEYENIEFVIKRKMASATFLPDEITKLKDFSIALLATLRQILTEQETC